MLEGYDDLGDRSGRCGDHEAVMVIVWRIPGWSSSLAPARIEAFPRHFKALPHVNAGS